jgi:hypothetical protein
MQPTLSAHVIREISVKACVDPRSVRAYLEAKPQRSTVLARIEQALAALGLDQRGRTLQPAKSSSR